MRTEHLQLRRSVRHGFFFLRRSPGSRVRALSGLVRVVMVLAVFVLGVAAGVAQAGTQPGLATSAFVSEDMFSGLRSLSGPPGPLLGGSLKSSFFQGPQLGSSGTYRLEDIGDPSPSRRGGGNLGGRFGLGIILGRPTGLTGKIFFDATHALQLHVGWGLESESFIVVFDYLFHFPTVIPAVEPGKFVPYVGVGGRFGVVHDDARVGVRVPLGMAFLIRNAPVEIFLELAIGIELVPETDGLVDGGIGGRYYF